MVAQNGQKLNTPEEALLFSSDLAIQSTTAILSGALCYGVFLVLTVMALQTLGKRTQPHARPTRVLYWTILFLLFLFSVSVALQAGGYMVLLRWPRITSPAVSFRERYNSVIAQYSKLQKAMFMLHPFPYMAADAVPIWRAYVLWPHSRKAKALLITVCGLNMVFCVTRSILEYIVFEFPRLHKMAPFLYPAQLAFSTITNGVVTIAIGIRAWHHRELTKDLRRTSSNPVYILLVLVEAGAFLCITQTLNLIMAFLGFFLGASLTSPYLLTGMVFSIFGDTVAAAYPALIVIVLSFRGSMLERTHQGLTGTLYRSEGGVVEMQQGREGRLTTIQFAASGGQSIDSRTRSNSDNSENHRMKKEGD